MPFFRLHTILFSALSIFVCISLKAQITTCPANLDFEMGDFSNWECRTGTVAESGGQNTITWDGFGQVPGRHEIISPGDNSLDPYGGFPQHCPNGSGYSIRLGNNIGGHEA